MRFTRPLERKGSVNHRSDRSRFEHRMIVATALGLGATLLTADARPRAYKSVKTMGLSGARPMQRGVDRRW